MALKTGDNMKYLFAAVLVASSLASFGAANAAVALDAVLGVARDQSMYAAIAANESILTRRSAEAFRRVPTLSEVAAEIAPLLVEALDSGWVTEEGFLEFLRMTE